MRKAGRLAIEESDIRKVIPGAKAYWNARGLPSTLSGCCREDFFVDGRRYSCEMRWGHIGDEHAAKATKYGANGDSVEVWVYGKAPPKRSEP